MFSRKSRFDRGSLYLLVISLIGIILILGFAWIRNVTHDAKQTNIVKKRFVSFYIASSGIDIAVKKVKDYISLPLIDSEGKVNWKKLDFLNPEKAKEFKLNFSDDTIIDGGKLDVSIYLKNFNATKFNTQIATEDQLPDDLRRFMKSISSESGKATVAGDGVLGGWEAEMIIRSTGDYYGEKRAIEVVKGIKVTDVTPIASEYTLFIHGSGEENLRSGKFVLSNWRFQSKLSKDLLGLVDFLLQKAAKAIPNVPSADLNQMIAVVKNFVTSTNDSLQKKKANELIMTLHPWGRIRTNGKLNVYLPFFEVDDVINYFVDNKYYQRPEVGYVGCYNRLHDRYMSKYTRYEGEVSKFYYELAPYVLQKQYPRAKSSKYTRFSTRPYYVEENPEERMPENLERVLEYGRKYASVVYPQGQRFFGTKDKPIIVDGIVFVEGEAHLGGYVRGRGMLVVQGEAHIENDVKKYDSDTIFSLVVPKHKVICKRPSLNFEGCIYSKDSIKSGKMITVTGNLVVENLKREKGGGAANEMPDIVNINYDPDIRNRMADNLVVTISRSYLSYKEVTP